MNDRNECRCCVMDSVMMKIPFTGNFQISKCSSCQGICIVSPNGNGDWYSYQGSVVRAPTQ